MARFWQPCDDGNVGSALTACLRRELSDTAVDQLTPTAIIVFSPDSGAPQPGAFFCVTGARYTFGINRWSAL